MRLTKSLWNAPQRPLVRWSLLLLLRLRLMPSSLLLARGTLARRVRQVRQVRLVRQAA